MKTPFRFAFALGALALLLAGCENLATTGSSPSLSVSATRSSILVNESATVIVKSANTLGTRPKIAWTTTLGTITPVKEGMLDFRKDKPAAIFTSDKPGTAMVTVTLTMDDGKVLQDTAQIEVNALH